MNIMMEDEIKVDPATESPSTDAEPAEEPAQEPTSEPETPEEPA